MIDDARKLYNAHITEVQVGNRTAGTVRYRARGFANGNQHDTLTTGFLLPARGLPSDVEIVPHDVGVYVILILDKDAIVMTLPIPEQPVFSEC